MSLNLNINSKRSKARNLPSPKTRPDDSLDTRRSSVQDKMTVDKRINDDKKRNLRQETDAESSLLSADEIVRRPTPLNDEHTHEPTLSLGPVPHSKRGKANSTKGQSKEAKKETTKVKSQVAGRRKTTNRSSHKTAPIKTSDCDEAEESFVLSNEPANEECEKDGDNFVTNTNKSTKVSMTKSITGKLNGKKRVKKIGRTRNKNGHRDSDDEDDGMYDKITSGQGARTSTRRVNPMKENEDASSPSNGWHGAKTVGCRRSSRRSVTLMNLKDESESDVEVDLDNRLPDDIIASSILKPSSVGETENLCVKHTRSRGRKDAGQNGNGSQSEEGLWSATRSNGRASRAAASRAVRKMADYFEDDPLPARRPKKADDDAEFEADDDADSSESDFEKEDESSSVGSRRKVYNVDVDASFFDADDSDDTDPKAVSLKAQPSSKQPSLVESEDEDESDEENDCNPSPELASPHMPFCQSITDAITLDPIPKKHICFFMPDGKTKQCFALETLHKIALSEPVMFANENVTFKQPPHFRSPMSAEMVDQIASRFGRAAIDVYGHFYNPGKLDFDYTVNAEDLVNDEQFVDRVNKYVNNCMGSRDVYCCPICYIEAHRRLENDELEGSKDDDSSEDETENLNLEFVADPMTIVGCVDGDEFRLASAFCFGRLAKLKEHLRKDHTVETSAVEGNDLYKRFQIRAADGLLQRFLDKKKNRNHQQSHRISKQGEMVRYWFDGNNELFVYLLDLIDRWSVARPVVESDTYTDNSDVGLTEFVELSEQVKRFWSSFAIRGTRIWDVVSEPYQKGMKQELDDFLDDDENEDGAVTAAQFHLMNREIESHRTPEEEIVAALRQSRGKETELSSDTEECVENDEEEESDDVEEEKWSSSSDDQAIMMKYYSEESEEDEWEQGLKSKRKARTKNDRIRNNVKIVEAKAAKILGGGKKRALAANLPDRTDMSQSNSASAKKRRLVIQESESD